MMASLIDLPATRLWRLLGMISVLCFCFSAKAQLHRVTDPVMIPNSAYLLQDDAFAAEVNPALIGLLPTFSAAYEHAELDVANSWLSRGDAFHLATPLFFGLAAGMSLHSVRPLARAVPGMGEQAERSMAVLSLAFAPSERFSIGLSGRAISSANPLLDGLATMDFGLALRPSPLFGITLAARDLFLSRNGFGADGIDAGSTFVGGLQIRPFGTTAVILDGSVVMDTSRNLGGRAGLGFSVPRIGVVSAGAEMEPLGQKNSEFRLLAEFAASYGQATAAFGVVGGDGFGSGLDWYTFVRADGRPRTDRVAQGVVLDVELSALSPRSILSTTLLLLRARHDRRVAGVLIRPRNSGMGTAYAQEIRMLLQELRDAGKITACHLEEATGAEYYACAGADEVSIDPAGSIRLMGASTTVLLFGDTLRKIHVNADFLRIGSHKSAPEQFTNKRLSDEGRSQLQGLLDDVQARTLSDLAKDLNTSQVKVAELMDQGPQLASVAMHDNLVSSAVDSYEASQEGTPALSERSVVRALSEMQPDHFGVASRLGVVLIDETIVDGKSTDVPILGLHASGSKTVIDAIEGLAADPTVRAIVLRVDSPGGSVLASDQIWRAVMRARKKKPVIASMGRVAASGGYYVASAADEIWADPSTLTGSIGIFFGKVDVSELAEKLGVGVELLRRGKRADADSIFRPFTPDERAALAEVLRRYYRLFLARIAEGRGMEIDKIHALGQGKVYSGDAALHHGLIDHLGGFASALTRARQLAGLGPEPEVVIVPEGPKGLLDLVLGGSQASTSDIAAKLPPVIRQGLFSFLATQSLQGSRAMALLPYAIDY